MSDLISKFLSKSKTEDVIHTSAYAKEQNGGRMGAASTQSFADRMKIEQNRQRVRGYRESSVVSGQGREAWRIRQEARQMGDGGVAGLKGGAGVGAGGAEKTVGAETNSRGGIKSQPPATRNPGVSRKI